VQTVTFSADESVIEQARRVARSENRTLDDAFREWLDSYASRITAVASRRQTLENVEALFRRLKYVDAGRKFTRDEMNER
jgi:hypothetical protein